MLPAAALLARVPPTKRPPPPHHHPRGIHAFADVRCQSDDGAFVALAYEVVRTTTHGCLAICFTYDLGLRQSLPALPGDKATQPDGRLPAAVEALGQRLPQLDWAMDYVRGDTVLLERPVEH